MDQYITVTSTSQDPCNFVSNFTDTINLNDGYEVAVTRIYHAPVYNVTKHNNKFTLAKDTNISDHFIPVGYYAGTCDIMAAINTVLVKASVTGSNENGGDSLIHTKPTFMYSKSVGEASSLKIVDTGVTFLIDNNRDNDAMLLKLLGYCVNGRFDKIVINHFVFEVSTDAGFLYSNIVNNSMINQQQSRLLALIPIRSKPGYNYHEFINPVYGPLSVHSFTDITFALTDVRGDVIKLDNLHSSQWGRAQIEMYPTIVTLHIRKSINRSLWLPSNTQNV